MSEIDPSGRPGTEEGVVLPPEPLRSPGGVEEWEPNLAACAYYMGIGTCSFGCREEPSCMADEPDGGWPPIMRHPYAEQAIRALRLQWRTKNWLGWLVWRPYPDHLKTYVSQYGYHGPTRVDILRWMNTPENERSTFQTAEQARDSGDDDPTRPQVGHEGPGHSPEDV